MFVHDEIEMLLTENNMTEKGMSDHGTYFVTPDAALSK
jgi:hypothetical protein